MKTIRFLILTLFSFASVIPLQANSSSSQEIQTIPFAEIGAKTTANYQGDAIGIRHTEDGATLRTGFQKLSGNVSSEGLWLDSTADEGGRLHLVASAIGRQNSHRHSLAITGTVSSTDNLATFSRPGLTEEYSVSVDGVRQDFIVAASPEGVGMLSVELTLSGAQAEAAPDGAKLTFDGSGRMLVYNRLRVTDAAGRSLPATLAVLSPSRLSVRVEDGAALYPVRIDPTFSDADWVSLNPGIPGTDGSVNATVVDSSGTLYIGGSFTFVGNVAAKGLAKWDGSNWSTVGTGINITFQVNALAVSGTDLYVGGNCFTATPTLLARAAKWNGSSWSFFGTGINSDVYALAVSGTNLYVGGSFTTAGGVPVNHVAKWNGSAWSALGSGTSGGFIGGAVYALAMNGADLYAGGFFTTAGGVAASRIAKWNGSVWSALGAGIGSGFDGVRVLAVSGTDLYAGGDFTNAGGISANGIAKWNGTVWSALGSGVGGLVLAMAVNGTDLYVGGSFGSAGGVSANRIAKWNGTAWSALGSGADFITRALAVRGTDICLGGSFTSAGGVSAKGIAKWNGTDWSAFGTGIDADVRAVAVSGTDIFVGGDFTAAGGTTANHVAKWNGSIWSALGAGTDNVVASLAVDDAGHLYAGGFFTTAGGISASRIAKWDGTAWSALGSGLDNNVYVLSAIGTDIYVGGGFMTAGGVPANYIAKWSGSTWSALGTGMNESVWSLAAKGTDLYAGGYFTTAGGVSANYIAKWDGSAWSPLGSGTNSRPSALAISGTDLYAGGDFTSAGGVAGTSYMAKWDGSAWAALGSGMDNPVNALAVSGTEIYAGGIFTTAGGVAASRIAKWDGAAWSALGTGANHYVSALAVNVSGQLFLGGGFTSVGTTVSPFIAQADLPLTAIQAWRQQYFGTTVNAGPAADLQDPDTDGLSNLVEFAFAMNPMESGTQVMQPGTGNSGLPYAYFQPGAPAPRVAMEFVRRRNAGITYLPEFSLDLATWTPALPADETVLPINADWERVTILDPVTTTQRRFGRVRVSAP